MFDVALVNTEEGVVSVFQELLFWREGLDTRLWRSILWSGWRDRHVTKKLQYDECDERVLAKN